MFTKWKKSKKILGTCLVMASLLLAGCGGNGDENGEAQAGGSVATGEARNTSYVALSADPVSLDPHGSNDGPSATVIYQVFSTLVRQEPDMSIHPNLATSWEQIDDLTWEFHLRDDVYFHNGEQMTADDVVFTFQRASESPKIAPIVEPINPDSVVAIDGFTVHIGTHQPFSPLLDHLAHMAAAIVNETAINYYGQDVGRNPVGTGPYKFVNWVSDDRVYLTRNENYFGDAANIENIVFRVIIEGTARTIELESGDLDIALSVPPVDVERVDADPSLTLFGEDSLRTTYVIINTQREPFDQVEVRRAVSHALDIDGLVNAVFEGTEGRAKAPISPAVWGHNPDLTPVNMDLDLAREYLAVAGLADGFDTSILVSNDQVSVDVATIIANQLGEIGNRVEVDTLEWGTFITALDQGEHALSYSSWTTVTGDGDYGLLPLFHSSQWGSAGNFSFFADDRVDELLEQGRVSTDYDTRLAAYLEAQELLSELRPRVWLTHGRLLVGARADVRGIDLHPRGIDNLSRVYFE